MERLGLVIIGIWVVLFGGAYGLCVAGWSRWAAMAVITSGYGILCGLTWLWFATGRAVVLGAFGMLLPYAMALVLIRLWPARRA